MQRILCSQVSESLWKINKEAVPSELAATLGPKLQMKCAKFLYSNIWGVPMQNEFSGRNNKMNKKALAVPGLERIYKKWVPESKFTSPNSNIEFFFFNYYYYYYFYCSGFCHTLKWNSHGFTCVPHPNPPSHLPLHPIPLGLPSALSPSACLMHPTWAGDLFHPR